MDEEREREKGKEAQSESTKEPAKSTDNG